MIYLPGKLYDIFKLKSIQIASLFLVIGAFLFPTQIVLANNAFNTSKVASFYNTSPLGKKGTIELSPNKMVKNAEEGVVQQILLVHSSLENSGLSFVVSDPKNGQKAHEFKESYSQQFLYDRVAIQTPLRVKVIHTEGRALRIWIESTNS